MTECGQRKEKMFVSYTLKTIKYINKMIKKKYDYMLQLV